MIPLRVVSQDAKTITLGWDAVPGAEAYVFYVNGNRVSRSCDRKKTTVKFGKVPGATYTVEAVTFSRLDQGTYPEVVTYVKVAPRVAYKTDRGDARFCMFNPDGSLRPGVSRLPNGQYTDESGAKYQSNGDGLEESGVRSPEPAVTASDQIDGRPYCSLPLEGDPTKNTGSWKI